MPRIEWPEGQTNEISKSGHEFCIWSWCNGDTFGFVGSSLEETRAAPNPRAPPTSDSFSASDQATTSADSAWLLGMDDEGYDDDRSVSSTETVDSAIHRWVWENGRAYAPFGQDCGMPIDEPETERQLMQHEMLKEYTGGLFMAPLGDEPQRILDVGTGSGIWAEEVADLYPGAVVVGVDTAPIQPTLVLPNCSFQTQDVEDTWTQKDNSFDFIHARDLLLAVRDWPALIHQMYEKIRPGGWCELAGTYVWPRQIRGTVGAAPRLMAFHRNLFTAAELYGTPLDFPIHFRSYLQQAGFRNVVEKIFYLPCAPTSGSTEHGDHNDVQPVEGHQSTPYPLSVGLRIFGRGFGWDQRQIETEMAGLRQDLLDLGHQYSLPYYVVYGQK